MFKFKTEARELVQVFEIKVDGTPTALEVFNGKLVAAYGYKLHFFTWKDMTLMPDVATYSTSMMTVSVQALSNKELLVADYLEPLELVSVDHGTITQKCRDIFHGTFTSVVPVTPSVYLATDSFGNIFCVEKRKPRNSNKKDGKTDSEDDDDDDDDDDEDEAKKKEWYMTNVGEFHLGEYVTCLKKVSMSKKEGNVFTYTTTNGSVGEVWKLSREDFAFWAMVEGAIAGLNVSQVGGLKHDEWREYYTERRITPATRFVDFDLIGLFKDLDRNDKTTVFRALSQLNLSSVEELTEKINTLLEQ